TLDALRINRPPLPQRRMSVVIGGGALVTIAIVVFLIWWLTRSKIPIVHNAISPPTAPTTQVSGSGVLLNASGYVTARRQSTVSSKVTGKVVEVLVEEGMKVSAGQVLARLDSSNVEKNLLLAEARHESARKMLGETDANLVYEKSELNRLKRMAE